MPEFLTFHGDVSPAVHSFHAVFWWITHAASLVWLFIAWKLIRITSSDPSEIVFLGTGFFLYALGNVAGAISSGLISDIIRCGLAAVSIVLAGVVWDRMREFEKIQSEGKQAWKDIEPYVRSLEVYHGSD